MITLAEAWVICRVLDGIEAERAEHDTGRIGNWTDGDRMKRADMAAPLADMRRRPQ